MNPRFIKELRPLLMPWCVTAIAAVGHLVALGNPVFANGAFGSFLAGIAVVAFVGGVLILAGTPVAAELQGNTLLLLFSQPVERTRLWREKLLAATFAIVSLGVVHGIAFATTRQLTLLQVVFCGAFAVVAISSVAYHTLATGSLLIGIAAAVGLPYALALCTFVLIRFGFGFKLELNEDASVGLALGASAVYSGICLWLSRRQFINFQLRGGGAGRAAEIPAALVPGKLSQLFRSRPTGATANLIRKEVCLQKPVFLVSAIFVACWLITLAFMILRPEWHGNLIGVFHGLTGAQVVLMAILTGCVSLGDDKALGTAAWHLTLPVSARRQWFIKLAVAIGTLVAMAIVLPVVLATLTLFKAKVGLLVVPLSDIRGMLLSWGILFLVSFWSASMVSNTVRAALTTMLALFTFGFMLPLAYNLTVRLRGLTSHSAGEILGDGRLNEVAILGFAGVALFALYQSFRQFRRAESRPTTLLWNMGGIALALFAVIFLRVQMYH